MDATKVLDDDFYIPNRAQLMLNFLRKHGDPCEREAKSPKAFFEYTPARTACTKAAQHRLWLSRAYTVQNLFGRAHHYKLLILGWKQVQGRVELHVGVNASLLHLLQCRGMLKQCCCMLHMFFNSISQHE